MHHIVSAADSASVSRHLNWWTPQTEVFSAGLVLGARGA